MEREPERAQLVDDEHEPEAGAARVNSYPEQYMPYAQTTLGRYEEFDRRREDFLLDYGYNTARAYWSDLDAICVWALERDKDPLVLTEQDLKQYIALLRRRKYSENTIRRRRQVWGRFRA